MKYSRNALLVLACCQHCYLQKRVLHDDSKGGPDWPLINFIFKIYISGCHGGTWALHINKIINLKNVQTRTLCSLTKLLFPATNKGQSKAGQANRTRVSVPWCLPDSALAEHHRQHFQMSAVPAENVLLLCLLLVNPLHVSHWFQDQWWGKASPDLKRDFAVCKQPTGVQETGTRRSC